MIKESCDLFESFVNEDILNSLLEGYSGKTLKIRKSFYNDSLFPYLIRRKSFIGSINDLHTFCKKFLMDFFSCFNYKKITKRVVVFWVNRLFYVLRNKGLNPENIRCTWNYGDKVLVRRKKEENKLIVKASFITIVRALLKNEKGLEKWEVEVIRRVIKAKPKWSQIQLVARVKAKIYLRCQKKFTKKYFGFTCRYDLFMKWVHGYDTEMTFRNAHKKFMRLRYGASKMPIKDVKAMARKILGDKFRFNKTHILYEERPKHKARRQRIAFIDYLIA